MVHPVGREICRMFFLNIVQEMGLKCIFSNLMTSGIPFDMLCLVVIDHDLQIY